MRAWNHQTLNHSVRLTIRHGPASSPIDFQTFLVMCAERSRRETYWASECDQILQCIAKATPCAQLSIGRLNESLFIGVEIKCARNLFETCHVSEHRDKLMECQIDDMTSWSHTEIDRLPYSPRVGAVNWRMSRSRCVSQPVPVKIYLSNARLSHRLRVIEWSKSTKPLLSIWLRTVDKVVRLLPMTRAAFSSSNFSKRLIRGKASSSSSW